MRKHAGTRQATVTLRHAGPDHLTVVVADDGRGFAPGRQGGGTTRPLGLTSMRERVELLGGSLRLESQPGLGTVVTATIPIPRAKREENQAAFATSPG